MPETWWIASCTHCGRLLGGLQSEGLADSWVLMAMKSCPEAACAARFTKQATGPPDGGRWNYRVEARPRARMSTDDDRPAAVVDLAVIPIPRLLGSPSGRELLEDLEELNEVSRRALPNATLALWAKILHGAIWTRGHREGWWKREWDELSLANVLNKRSPSGPYPEIARRTASSLVERLAHRAEGGSDRTATARYPRTSDAEAWSAVDALSEFLTVWF